MLLRFYQVPWDIDLPESARYGACLVAIDTQRALAANNAIVVWASVLNAFITYSDVSSV